MERGSDLEDNSAREDMDDTLTSELTNLLQMIEDTPMTDSSDMDIDYSNLPAPTAEDLLPIPTEMLLFGSTDAQEELQNPLREHGESRKNSEEIDMEVSMPGSSHGKRASEHVLQGTPSAKVRIVDDGSTPSTSGVAVPVISSADDTVGRGSPITSSEDDGCNTSEYYGSSDESHESDWEMRNFNETHSSELPASETGQMEETREVTGSPQVPPPAEEELPEELGPFRAAIIDITEYDIFPINLNGDGEEESAGVVVNGNQVSSLNYYLVVSESPSEAESLPGIGAEEELANGADHNGELSGLSSDRETDYDVEDEE